MKILILERDRYLVESKTKPIPGKRYNLEDAVTGTKAQNKTFHALISCFFKWMLSTDTFQYEVDGTPYDFRYPDYLVLKDVFKMKYGAGHDHLEYVNDKNQMISVKYMEDVPDYVIKDFNLGNRQRVKQVLKSWSQYTKKQRTDLIETTLNLMKSIGVDSKKFTEILDGMEKNNESC